MNIKILISIIISNFILTFCHNQENEYQENKYQENFKRHTKLVLNKYKKDFKRHTKLVLSGLVSGIAFLYFYRKKNGIDEFDQMKKNDFFLSIEDYKRSMNKVKKQKKIFAGGFLFGVLARIGFKFANSKELNINIITLDGFIPKENSVYHFLREAIIEILNKHEELLSKEKISEIKKINIHISSDTNSIKGKKEDLYFILFNKEIKPRTDIDPKTKTIFNRSKEIFPDKIRKKFDIGSNSYSIHILYSCREESLREKKESIKKCIKEKKSEIHNNIDWLFKGKGIIIGEEKKGRYNSSGGKEEKDAYPQFGYSFNSSGCILTNIQRESINNRLYKYF